MMNPDRALQSKVIFLCLVFSVLFSCFRDNPVDPKASNFIPGTKPHAKFIQRSISGFLYDSVVFKILCSDTAAGGIKDSIKKFYFSWNNDTAFNDSISGTELDTFFFSKTFPVGTMIVRLKAENNDGQFSEIDSLLLIISTSHPRITGMSAPLAIEKEANCTLSVSADDTGGKIQSYLWAKDGKDFTDTSLVGNISVTFKDTGEYSVLVKVRDNKAIESAIDTFHFVVFEKFHTTFYDGSGSTGGSIPIDATRYSQGQSVTVFGNTGALVRSGFAFTGWNTLANGRGASYTAGSTFTMDTTDVTLFAQWEIVQTYSITYDGNGTTGGNAPTDTAHYALGQSAMTMKSGSLVKSGFTFMGWNTQANDSATSYATGVTFIMGSTNVTLYAQWTANPTYGVTYNGNGNSGGTGPADNNNYVAGAAVTVLGNTGALVKTGSTFVGWNTLASGLGTSYAPGASFAMGTANVILYAKWTTNPTYTLSYNGSGSTAGTVPADNNNYLAGATVTILGNTGLLVRAGFTFTGWDTVTAGNGADYAAGATFKMPAANEILYAQWANIPTYSVTYNGSGNTGGNAPADIGHYTLGQSVTVLGAGSLVKTGYAFVGWNTLANGSGISYASGVTFSIGSANMVLFAQWTADPTFTVTYIGNGNSGGTAPADNNNYMAGSTVLILGNTGSLVKTGSTFVGWNTQASGNGASYAVGANFAMGFANVILFAKWTANPTYTLTYNGSGNTSGTAPVDNNNYLSGATITILGNTGSLVKAGYSFTGWDTVMAGNGSHYAPGATFKMPSANEILYAQWTIIPTYSVTYGGNGNTGGNAPIDNAHYIFGQGVTVLGNTGSLLKAGSTFVGWNTQANGSGSGYTPGIVFIMGSLNVTLYALWTPNPTYSITYVGNGNSGGTAPADNNNYQSGAAVTVLGNTGSLVKTGATFVGWNTLSSGLGTNYAPGAGFVMGPANMILYAKWTANPTYTLTYNGSGNTGGTAPVDNNNYLAGAIVTILGNAGLLVRAGYSFTGWDTIITGNGTNYSAGATFKMPSVNLTLYAQWAVIPTYTVTYNGSGNTGGNAPADNTHYLLGQSVSVLGNTGALVKAGFSFTGWNTLPGGNGISYATGVTFTMGSSNLTLYAQWTPNPTYTITYNGNGNSGGTVPTDNNNYLPSASVAVLGNTGFLVKTGSTFAGWNTLANGSGASYAPGAIFAMGASNATLFAQWSVIPTYTVTYNGSGSTGGTVPADNNTYLPGATVIVLGNTGSLVNAGYTFAGWNTLANGSGLSYAGGAVFAMGSLNVTLYAQWTIIPTFTVTYSGSGNTGGIAPTDNAHYVFGQTVTVLGNTGALVKTGALFTGWNTQANGNGISYAPGVSFTIGSSNVTLFAQWAVTSTVTYTANGNTIGTVPTDTAHYTLGQSVTVLGNTGALLKTGFIFTGWNTKQNGNGTGYAAGETFTMGSSNVTLYAVWTPFAAPTLVSPANSATNQPAGITLSWNPVNTAANYQLQASLATDFSSTIYDNDMLTGSSQAIGPLSNAATYYWRVRALTVGGVSAWSTSWTFTTADTIAPTVSLTNPVSGSTAISATGNITATFSKVMNPATITASTFTLVNDSTLVSVPPTTITYTAGAATFTPSASLDPATTFTATITTGVTDAVGNHLATSYSWKFTTQ